MAALPAGMACDETGTARIQGGKSLGSNSPRVKRVYLASTMPMLLARVMMVVYAVSTQLALCAKNCVTRRQCRHHSYPLPIVACH